MSDNQDKGKKLPPEQYKAIAAAVMEISEELKLSSSRKMEAVK
jgi:hypothetical protein